MKHIVAGIICTFAITSSLQQGALGSPRSDAASIEHTSEHATRSMSNKNAIQAVLPSYVQRSSTELLENVWYGTKYCPCD